jgi:hypothetical protein
LPQGARVGRLVTHIASSWPALPQGASHPGLGRCALCPRPSSLPASGRGQRMRLPAQHRHVSVATRPGGRTGRPPRANAVRRTDGRGCR